MSEITLDTVNESLILSNGILPEKRFVGVAVIPDDDGKAIHSGLIIKYNEEALLFDFDSEFVRLSKLPHPRLNVFYKELSFITPDEVPAFLAHCQQIEKHSKPKFGYFYGGDYYKEGKHFSASGLPEYMTCVGFCINIVQGFIEGQYFSYSDWVEGAFPSYDSPDDYFDDFLSGVQAKFPDQKIDEKLFRANLRRITPGEFTSGAYLEDFPITKEAIAPILTLVEQVLLQKVGQLIRTQKKSA